MEKDRKSLETQANDVKSNVIYASYQECPVCKGSGFVSTPIFVAGNLPYWSGNSTGPYTCRVCSGQGIITTHIITQE